MNRDFLENLKVLAAINQNYVSEQNLKLLGEKYSLSDTEMRELNQYCKDIGIGVYDEEKKACIPDDSCVPQPTSKAGQMKGEGENEDNRRVSIIARHIMHIATIRARKRVNHRGWLCGTYTSSVRRSVEQKVRRCFSSEEMKFIIDHLTDSDEEELFAMKDQQSSEICDILNNKLNEIIPQLHINRFYSDFLDDD